MDELKFVLRCFIFSAAVLMLTQLKTGNVTIENRIEASLMNSRTAEFVNKVAHGGVQLIKDVVMLGKSTYQEWGKPAITQVKGDGFFSLQPKRESASAQEKTKQPEAEDGDELLSEEE